MGKPVINLALDSGAFSAWSLGRTINLDEYISFIKTNEAHIEHVVNLDKIAPGNPEVAAAEGMKNFYTMKDAGLNVIPVFHARENLKWLVEMCDASNYVGLSQTSLVSPTEGHLFYDICYSYLTDKEGRPLVKTHLFGDTSPKSLMTYPATSADSATWMIQAGRAARVKFQGRAIQLKSSKIRDTSYISDDDSGPKRQSWEEEMRMLGLNPDKVMTIKTTPSEMAMIRSYMVAADLLRFRERTRVCTKYKRTANLIKTKRAGEGQERTEPIKILFVLSPSAYYFNLPLVLLLGVSDVLVSYFYVANAPTKFWPERLVPFLYEPLEYCMKHDKVKRYMDKMLECMLQPPDLKNPMRKPSFL